MITDATADIIGRLPLSVIKTNESISTAAFLLGLAQLPFIFNFFRSMFVGEKVVSDNPWESTTLEWQTPTPPPHGNFATEIKVYRGPYEYSVPGAARDFTTQNEVVRA
jgi:cytochrome c oxidase subunit 1